jgi:hypothetical protein
MAPSRIGVYAATGEQRGQHVRIGLGGLPKQVHNLVQRILRAS